MAITLSLKPITEKTKIPPAPKDGDRKNNPAGTYTANKFEFNKTKGTGLPYLKARKSSGELMAIGNFHIVGGGKQGFFPLYEGELSMFVQGVVKQSSKPNLVIPEQPHPSNAGAVSNYLLQIENIINTSGVEITFVVNDSGFISHFENMNLPDNFYFWRVVKVLSVNDAGQPSWEIRKWQDGGTSYRMQLLGEVLAEMDGPSPYAGFTFYFEIDYALEYDPENNNLNWAVRLDGEPNASAERHGKLWAITAPTWMNDVSGWSDFNNLVPLWMSKIDPTKCIFSNITFEKYYNVNISTAVSKPLPKGVVPVQVVSKSGIVVSNAQSISNEAKVVLPEQNKESSNVLEFLDGEYDLSSRKLLKELFSIIAGFDVIDDTFEPIKPNGIAWLKANISPLKKQGLIKQGKISTMDFGSICEIATACLEHVAIPKGIELVAEQIQQQMIQLPLIGENKPLFEVEDDEEDGDF